MSDHPMSEAAREAYHLLMAFGDVGFGKTFLIRSMGATRADPSQLAEAFVFKGGLAKEATGMYFMTLSHSHHDVDVLPAVVEWRKDISDYSHRDPAELGLKNFADRVRAVGSYIAWAHAHFYGRYDPDTEVLERMYSGGARALAALEPGLPASGRVRVRVRRGRRTTLAEMYERRLQAATREISEATVEQTLAAAAANRSVAAVLMENDWIGLHCLLAIDQASGMTASDIAEGVERDRDDVAVALANLVQHGLLAAAEGVFKRTQFGAIIRSRVASLTKA